MHASHTRRALAVTGLAATTLGILACSGLPGAGEGPAWPAEPVALVDLPDEEFPTALALLPDAAFVTTVRAIVRDDAAPTVASGGVRFRAADGGAGPRADVALERDRSADSLAVAPDGARVAVGRYDELELVPLDGGAARSLPLYDALDTSGAALLARCTRPRQLLWAGGTIVAGCSVGPPVVLVDVETGARTLPLEKYEPDGSYVTVTDLALSADARTFAVAGSSTGGTGPEIHWVELRTVADGALVRRLPLTGSYDDVAIAPDGARIAVSHPYFGLQILDAADGRVIAEHVYPPDAGNRGSGDVLWSADGARLFRVGRRLSVTAHDGTDASVLGYFPAHPTEPANPMPPPSDWPATLAARNGTLSLSPDGRFLGSVERSDFGRAVRIWRLPAP